MERVLLDVEKKLEIILREMFKYDFVPFKEEINGEKLLIIDDSGSNYHGKIYRASQEKIGIIVLLSESNLKELERFVLDKNIYKCFFKSEIYLLEKALENFFKEDFKRNIKLREKNKFFLNIPYGRIILKFEEITHITYSSLTRKSEFYDMDKNIWAIRKNISEVEKELVDGDIFFRLDRGTIINSRNVKMIDYADEKLIFKNENFIYTSRAKLKNLEENINMLEYIIL